MKKLLVAALLGFVLMSWGSLPLLAQTEIIIHFSGFGIETGGFDYSAPGPEGTELRGRIRPTGIRPTFSGHLEELGFELPGELFDSPGTR